MVATYITFDKLRLDGRDLVGTYVARNLSRPLALSFGAGWANVVVGNPPWLAFRHTSADLQSGFVNWPTASEFTLAASLRRKTISRLCSQCARQPSTFARAGALPSCCRSRRCHAASLRNCEKACSPARRIAWEEAWTMNDDVQPLFPVPSASSSAGAARPPRLFQTRFGHIQDNFRRATHRSEAADKCLVVEEDAPRPAQGQSKVGRPYRKSFRYGSDACTRAMLCIVERAPVVDFGMNPSSAAGNEEALWPREIAVEGCPEYRRVTWKSSSSGRTLFGESILPYRVFRPFEGVVPISSTAGC